MAIAPIYFYVHHTMAMTKSVNSFCTSFHIIRPHRYNITASRCIAIVTTVLRVSVNCICAYGRGDMLQSPYIAIPSHFHPITRQEILHKKIQYSKYCVALQLYMWHCEAEHTHMTEDDSRPAAQPKHDPKGIVCFSNGCIQCWHTMLGMTTQSEPLEIYRLEYRLQNITQVPQFLSYLQY